MVQSFESATSDVTEELFLGVCQPVSFDDLIYEVIKCPDSIIEGIRPRHLVLCKIGAGCNDM